MKFFHLSDLHSGLKLVNQDLREDQEYILKQIVRMACEKHPDAIVIAGDIYDRAVPSAEAVEVFDHFISDLAKELPELVVMLISGNHDSAPRVNCFRSLLAKQNIYTIGLPPQTEQEYIEKVVLCDSYGKVNFYLLPFVRPSMVKQVVGVKEDNTYYSYNDTLHRLIEREQIDSNERNVVVSHQFYLPVGKNADEIERMDSEIQTVGNIDKVYSDMLEVFDYAALGHIHRPIKVGSEVFRYCGTPLACSVSEAGQQKGVVMVELKEKGTAPDISVLPLNPLRKVNVIQGGLKEILKQACKDYVAVTLTSDVEWDLDVQSRIQAAFPNLLEVHREIVPREDGAKETHRTIDLDPLQLCCDFRGDLDDLEKEILQDVINTVKEM